MTMKEYIETSEKLELYADILERQLHLLNVKLVRLELDMAEKKINCTKEEYMSNIFKKAKKGIDKAKKPLKGIGEAVLDTAIADTMVTTIPERAVIHSIDDGNVKEGLEDTRDETFESIDRADAADKKATGYKDKDD